MTDNDKLRLVLINRYGGKAWCYNGDGYEGIAWTDSTPKPSEQELLDKYDDVVDEIQAAADAKVAALASARAKLAALGLTEAEVKALVG